MPLSNRAPRSPAHRSLLRPSSRPSNPPNLRPSSRPTRPATLSANCAGSGGSAETDGKWGQSSKAAVRLFNKHAKAKLDPEQASAAMLAALREREKRVCPLQCEAGFRVRGDTCVAVK